jgi:uncharacterized repeat protein (TIGR03943 family)
VSREAGGTAVLLVGLLLVRLALTEIYQRYVRVEMGPWLLIAGVLLIGLGAVAVAAALRRSAPLSPAAPVEPEHHHGDRVGWLLLVPVLAVLLAPPPALGSFGVDRSASAVSVGGGGHTYDPLPPGGPHPLTLREFDERAVDASGASFAGRPVTLTGFVARPQDGTGFRLARFQISCCAADAVAAVVRVIDTTPPAPARDTWLTVIGTFSGIGADGIPELNATSTQPLPAPVDPYE